MLARLFDLYANLNPDGQFWVECGGRDDGENYCRKHAEEKIAADGDDTLCGGDYSESDSCCHCSVCGKLLGYVLTDHGAEAELSHFKSVKFRRNKPLDRVTAYHLARLIDARPNDLEVMRIAACAIRCMKQVPSVGKPNVDA